MPYKIHTILTGNGTHFTTTGNVCRAAAEIQIVLDDNGPLWTHGFERLRPKLHRSSTDQAAPPVDNGEVERMNRTLKEVTVRRYY